MCICEGMGVHARVYVCARVDGRICTCMCPPPLARVRVYTHTRTHIHALSLSFSLSLSLSLSLIGTYQRITTGIPRRAQAARRSAANPRPFCAQRESFFENTRNPPTETRLQSDKLEGVFMGIS